MRDMEDMKSDFLKDNKDNPFTVPNGYFDILPTRVQSYCQSKEQEVVKPSWVVAFRTQLALVSGFIVLVILGYVGYYYGNRVESIRVNSESEYVRIVEKHISEFDEVEIYEAILNGSKPKKDTIISQYNDEYLHYLLRDKMDNYSLIDHSKDIRP